jgi:hypothetical protein
VYGDFPNLKSISVGVVAGANSLIDFKIINYQYGRCSNPVLRFAAG